MKTIVTDAWATIVMITTDCLSNTLIEKVAAK